MYKTVLLCLFVVASLAPSSAEIVKRSKRGILDDLLRNDPHFSTKAPKVTKAPIRKTTTTEVPEVITTIATPSRQQVRRRKPARNNVPKKQPVKLQDPSKFKDIKLIGLDDLTVPKRIVTLRVQKVTTKRPKEVVKKQTTPKNKLTIEKPELIKNTEVNVEEEEEEDVEYVTEIPSKIAEKFRQKVDFTSDNIARKETVDEDGEIKGQYSYTDPNGKLLVVRYTAGKNGFNVEVPVEETKSSLPTPTLRIPQKTDNKDWINSLFARTPSPVRRTTTTTTTPAPTTTTTQPPTTTTTPPPQQFVPQRRQSFQEQPRSTFGQQRFQEQPRQQQRFQEQSRSGFEQQRFQEQPRSNFGQQRFQEQPRQQQLFQEQPRSGFEQQRFEAAPQPNQFSRLESSIQKQQNSHDQFLNQNRHRLFSQPPPQQQQQQFGQFQQQRPSQQAFNNYDYDYADQSNFQTRFN